MEDGVIPYRPPNCAELLRWSVSTRARGITVALEGELDLSNADALQKALLEVVHTRPAVLTVDLAHLTYLDSTGVHCLLDAAETAAASGCHLAVRRANTTVRRVLAICGVDHMLLDHSDGDSAEGR